MYAVTNDTELIEDKEFELFRKRYTEEIEIIQGVLTQEDEHLKETRVVGKETKFI